jgi:hypothetical protein
MVTAIVEIVAVPLVQVQVLDRIHHSFQKLQADFCLCHTSGLASSEAGIRVHMLVQPNFAFQSLLVGRLQLRLRRVQFESVQVASFGSVNVEVQAA